MSALTPAFLQECRLVKAAQRRAVDALMQHVAQAIKARSGHTRRALPNKKGPARAGPFDTRGVGAVRPSGGAGRQSPEVLRPASTRWPAMAPAPQPTQTAES